MWCKYCGNKIFDTVDNRLFCSRKCSYIYYKLRYKKPLSEIRNEKIDSILNEK